jgi:hypothetical protein
MNIQFYLRVLKGKAGRHNLSPDQFRQGKGDPDSGCGNYLDVPGRPDLKIPGPDPDPFPKEKLDSVRMNVIPYAV